MMNLLSESEEEKIRKLLSGLVLRSHDPIILNLGDDGDDIYIIQLLRDAKNDLTFQASRERPAGTSRLLQAAIIEASEGGETINNVVLHVNVGTVADKDEATIHLNSRAYYEVDGAELWTFLPGVDLGMGEKDIELIQKWDREAVIHSLRQETLEKKIKEGDPLTYVLSAHDDIEETARGIIPAISAMMPAKYHSKHFEIERQVFEAPEKLPSDLTLPTYEYKPLLKFHMGLHRELFKRRPLKEQQQVT